MGKEYKSPGSASVAILVGESTVKLGEVAPFTLDYHKVNDETTIYVCKSFACKRPTTSIEQAINMIMDRF